MTIPLWNNDYYEETLNGPIAQSGYNDTSYSFATTAKYLPQYGD